VPDPGRPAVEKTSIEGEGHMEAVARVTTITASSEKSFQDAVEKAVARASKTLRGVTGAEVQEHKAKVENGKITEFRATVNITFILEG
jgi:flavin-binding protein dodecin